MTDETCMRLLAEDLTRHGAEIATQTALVSARREGDVWRADLSDGRIVKRSFRK